MRVSYVRRCRPLLWEALVGWGRGCVCSPQSQYTFSVGELFCDPGILRCVTVEGCIRLNFFSDKLWLISEGPRLSFGSNWCDTSAIRLNSDSKASGLNSDSSDAAEKVNSTQLRLKGHHQKRADYMWLKMCCKTYLNPEADAYRSTQRRFTFFYKSLWLWGKTTLMIANVPPPPPP